MIPGSCLPGCWLAAADRHGGVQALEKALLSFHTTKMTDINKIVKELWQKTYQGTDIDSIQIKADADGARSYNYRVVMHSSGAELDMRGRCSTGQKASISWSSYDLLRCPMPFSAACSCHSAPCRDGMGMNLRLCRTMLDLKMQGLFKSC